MQKAWTKKELDFVKENSSTMTNKEIAKALGRTIGSIEHKVIRSELRKEEDSKFLRFNSNMDLTERIIMQEFGTSAKHIHKLLAPKKEAIKTTPIKTQKVARFAVVSDTHFGSNHEKIEELHAFYKLAKKRGCKFVIHGGDLIAGDDVFNNQESELKICGASRQIKHVIDNYPKELSTYFIQGNHDNSLAKGDSSALFESISLARKDMIYLGDTKAKVPFSNGISVMVVHPKSYNLTGSRNILNKIINRPDILILGHTHQAAYFCDKNTHLIYGGAFEGGGRYLDKQFMYPKIGGWIVEAELVGGNLCLKTEFIQFYDKGL